MEAQEWPETLDWIYLAADNPEDGWQDDSRDVESLYYFADSSHLYLSMCCLGTPTFTKMGSPAQEGRYKWFIDFEGDSYISGGSVLGTEYLLFAEDTDPDDGAGETCTGKKGPGPSRTEA